MFVYHVSKKLNKDMVFFPRVPRSRMMGENSTIPRICVAMNIIDALRGYNCFDIDDEFNVFQFEIKDNDILLMTEYPIYDKKLIFKSETKEIDEMLEYVTLFRNKKTESKISNEFEVIDYNNNELLNKMLKLNDKLVSKSKYNDKLTIELYNYKFDLFFDNSKNSLEEELKRKEEIEKLESSIARRKKLLSNENYVNKAPEAIVNKEREDLEKEEKRLEILKKN